MVWSKLKSPFRVLGRHGKEREDSSVNKLNVDEEYKEAFRTNSYTEICSKIRTHLRKKSMDTPSSSSFSSIPLYVHLSESLLEPRQETLADMIEGCNLHPLLVDYFKITLEACNLCELLLRSIHQTRANYHKIKRVIKLSKKAHNSTKYTDDQFNPIFQDLASFAKIKNPLSTISPVEYRDTQNRHNVLLYGLSSQCRKIRRRIKLRRGIKKVVGCSVVVGYTALTITLLALAFHTMVGIVTAPALLTCSVGFFKKRSKFQELRAGSSRVRVLGQLDVAAKGVYILINDFNTMSRLVRSLSDEIEHSKAMADMCVRNGKVEVLKEVAREFGSEEACFLEQLEELEELIYLCFLTINRSRRLVVDELMHGASVV